MGRPARVGPASRHGSAALRSAWLPGRARWGQAPMRPRLPMIRSDKRRNGSLRTVGSQISGCLVASTPRNHAQVHRCPRGECDCGSGLSRVSWGPPRAWDPPPKCLWAQIGTGQRALAGGGGGAREKREPWHGVSENHHPQALPRRRQPRQPRFGVRSGVRSVPKHAPGPGSGVARRQMAAPQPLAHTWPLRLPAPLPAAAHRRQAECLWQPEDQH